MGWGEGGKGEDVGGGDGGGGCVGRKCKAVVVQWGCGACAVVRWCTNQILGGFAPQTPGNPGCVTRRIRCFLFMFGASGAVWLFFFTFVVSGVEFYWIMLFLLLCTRSCSLTCRDIMALSF